MKQFKLIFASILLLSFSSSFAHTGGLADGLTSTAVRRAAVSSVAEATLYVVTAFEFGLQVGYRLNNREIGTFAMDDFYDDLHELHRLLRTKESREEVMTIINDHLWNRTPEPIKRRYLIRRLELQ